MIDRLLRWMSGLNRDLKAGMNAGGAAHGVGILAALALSAPLIVALFLLTPIGIAASAAIGATAQLFVGWIVAGRYERQRMTDETAAAIR
jgi:hypothetical protein